MPNAHDLRAAIVDVYAQTVAVMDLARTAHPTVFAPQHRTALRLAVSELVLAVWRVHRAVFGRRRTP